MEDVSFVRWANERLQGWTRILYESPTSPDAIGHVDLSSWETAIESVHRKEPALAFYREYLDEGGSFIGTNVRLLGDIVEADEISTEGTIDGQFALPTMDLTRVDFGGGYERGLWRMVKSARKSEE